MLLRFMLTVAAGLFLGFQQQLESRNHGRRCTEPEATSTPHTHTRHHIRIFALKVLELHTQGLFYLK